MNASGHAVNTGTDQESVRKLVSEAKYPLVLEDPAANDQGVRPLGMQDPCLLTVVEVAGVLGIGRSKVYELLYRGELKSVKIGSSRRVRYSDLGDFVRYLDDAS